MNPKNMRLDEIDKYLIHQYLYLIEIIIKRHIIMSNTIIGLSFEDLYQEGFFGLCKAVNRFNGSIKFESYASVIIRNTLIDYCRKVQREHNRLMYLSDETTLHEAIEFSSDDCQIRSLLENIKKEYRGCAKKGIEAIIYRLQGYSNKEIAQIYDVSNYEIGAWISFAKKHLKKDKIFMESMGIF